MPDQGNQVYLDALLADLQSTTEQYQHQQLYSQVNVPQQQTSIEGLHQTFTESLSYHQNCQPLYEPTNTRTATTNIVVTVKNQPPPQFKPDPQPIYANQPSDTGQQKPNNMSSLNKNLSQLDSLLEDLNSAQFMAEVDRRSGGYSSIKPNSPGSRQPPPVATKPPMNSSVDNLLAELQDSVPYANSGSQTQPHQTQNVITNQRTYKVSKEPMASSATRDLDDLMASLSEFKMNTSNVSGTESQVTVTATLNTASSTPASSEFIGSPAPEHNYSSATATQRTSSPVSSSSTGQPARSSPTPPPTPPFPRQFINGTESVVDQQQQQQQSKNVEPPYAKPNKLIGREQSTEQQQYHNDQQQQQHHTEQQYHHNQQHTEIQQMQQTSHSCPLDTMLGNLQTDMNKQGVSTVPKGHCAACNKPIVGQVITALGKIWHPEHFTCYQCQNELGTRNFFERDGLPFCETDYHTLFSPKCAYCNRPILDKCVSALDATWHPEHFVCAQCGRPFEDGDFHEKNGKPYCRDDYFEMFAPKCGGCIQPIMDNYISALNKQWHPECFICQDCHMPFSGGSFFEYEGLPFCETHYHAKKGSLCAGCNKPITGRCITAMYRKFHPEHFVCAFCLRQLNKGTFKEQNDKPYCHACFVKLFG
ncbi:paxillin-like isoform X2 [Tubulanus polymorphus]|uniref:paxillin-like isoform X2 n=1 Tax=Tubulanus polymorphus TaxID=672921 RepID=UPI003DA58C89